MRQRGFTLIEMIAVMVIMATLAVMALGSFNPNDYALSAARDELVGALRYAQSMSLSHTGATHYEVTLSTTGYSVTRGGAAIAHPVTGASAYNSSWSNVTLDSSGTVSFDGYGEPGLAGGLAWSGNQLVVTVSVGSVSDTLRVERITGFVR
ncbi:MAG TPA: prepilin-type N-terminal cleavage/methylation domain-containing protein [Gammaproteobacteria bacterium]|nr:prepilin-type N-terminal cleavage/methylation domain-containing protein [Gammaproteobacteria bacterium]